MIDKHFVPLHQKSKQNGFNRQPPQRYTRHRGNRRVRDMHGMGDSHHRHVTETAGKRPQ